MKFNNHYERQASTGETNTIPSRTVPDQSMTVREIINRTEKGLPVSGVRVPLYNETEDGIMPDLRNLDISEVVELKKRIAAKEKQIRKHLQQQAEEKQLAETEAYYKKKFQPEILEIQEVKKTDQH